jgi:hypothetical protein
MLKSAVSHGSIIWHMKHETHLDPCLCPEVLDGRSCLNCWSSCSADQSSDSGRTWSRAAPIARRLQKAGEAQSMVPFDTAANHYWEWYGHWMYQRVTSDMRDNSDADGRPSTSTRIIIMDRCHQGTCPIESAHMHKSWKLGPWPGRSWLCVLAAACSMLASEAQAASAAALLPSASGDSRTTNFLLASSRFMSCATLETHPSRSISAFATGSAGKMAAVCRGGGGRTVLQSVEHVGPRTDLLSKSTTGRAAGLARTACRYHQTPPSH